MCLILICLHFLYHIIVARLDVYPYSSLLLSHLTAMQFQSQYCIDIDG